MKEIVRKVRRWYSKEAKIYDSRLQKEFAEEFRKEFSGVSKLLKVKKGNKVLDVATGTGNYLILAAKRGAICYGIDISKKMIEVAKRKTKGMKNIKELCIEEANNLSYPSDYFNWITCIGMFEHYQIEEGVRILKEFKRILKKNGKIILDFPNKQHPEIKKAHADFLYDLAEIKKAFEKTGLKIIKTQKAGWTIQFLLTKRK